MAQRRWKRISSALEVREIGRNDPCPCGSGKKSACASEREQARSAGRPPVDYGFLWRAVGLEPGS